MLAHLKSKYHVWSFGRGFHDVIPFEAIAQFDEGGLELLLGGIGTINVKDWRDNTIYKNYQPSDTVHSFFSLTFPLFNPARWFSGFGESCSLLEMRWDIDFCSLSRAHPGFPWMAFQWVHFIEIRLHGCSVPKWTFFCRSSMDQTDHRSFASKRLEVKKAFQWLTPALTGLFIWKRPSDQNFCQVGLASLHFLSNPQVQTCSRCGGIAGLRWSGLVKQFSIQQPDSLSDSPPKKFPGSTEK